MAGRGKKRGADLRLNVFAVLQTLVHGPGSQFRLARSIVGYCPRGQAFTLPAGCANVSAAVARIDGGVGSVPRRLPTTPSVRGRSALGGMREFGSGA